MCWYFLLSLTLEALSPTSTALLSVDVQGEAQDFTIWLKDILSRRQFELGIDPKTTRTMISFGINKVF